MSVDPFAVVLGPIPDFDGLRTESKDYLRARSDEKDQLHQLNTRLASYIEKIHSLQLRNKKLTSEVESVRSYTSTSITEIQTEETTSLVKETDDLNNQLRALKLEHEKLQKRVEEETLSKTHMEELLKKWRLELEAEKQKLKSQTEELQKKMTSKQKVHEEAVEKLKITVPKGTDEVDMSKSELTVMLVKIREQYEAIAVQNITKAKELYKQQIEEQDKTYNKNLTDLKEANRKITELTSQSQKLTSEISSLEIKIKTMEDSHKHEKKCLDLKISEVTGNMNKLICLYEELLCVKMELDMEISYYRGLMEDEENRIEKSTQDNTTSSTTEKTKSSGDQEKTPNKKVTKAEYVVRVVEYEEKKFTSSNPDVSQGHKWSGITSSPSAGKH